MFQETKLLQLIQTRHNRLNWREREKKKLGMADDMLGEILKSRERKCRVLCHPFDDEWSHSKSAPTLSRVFFKMKRKFF